MSDERKIIPASAKPELVVIAHPEAEVQVSVAGISAAPGLDAEPLAELLFSTSVDLRPLFGLSEERLKRRAASIADKTGVAPPDLSVYYQARTPDTGLEALANELRADKLVSAAYVKPAAELPIMFANVVTTAGPTPSETPDFSHLQAYLRAAPVGIDADLARTLDGGGGEGVTIIDVEYAWRFDHEDLTQNQGGVVGGTPLLEDKDARNHGTAVLGIFSGDQNDQKPFGITGICPDSIVQAISAADSPAADGGSAAAIRKAADRLKPGDIILIELHRPGPRFNFEARADKRGYIPIEWWPDDLEAIQYATGRGIIVVEASGNGAENLDCEIYDVNPWTPKGLMFPAAWRNPFRRAPVDSGAIIVGAGTPSVFTDGFSEVGANLGSARSRLLFSNFGSMLDAQGWGMNVTTCGYGKLQNGDNENLWYTREFDGTSSATPIVVGSLACVQGILKAAGRDPLDPKGARELLRTTGAHQQHGLAGPNSERIGNLPDLKQMIIKLGLL